MKGVVVGVLLGGIVGNLGADETRTSGDLVEIRATISMKDSDGTLSVVSEPSLVLALGTWGEVEDSTEIVVPSDWTNLSLPQELGGLVAAERPNETSAEFETNTKQLIVPPQPDELNSRTYGWLAKFRPRLLSSDRIEVDCLLNHTVFLGYSHVSNPIRYGKKGALGTKGKVILVDSNTRIESSFATRKTKLTFLPSESGHIAKTESETLSPSSVKASSVPQMEVRLSVKRLDKRKPKRSSYREPAVHLTTRFFEISDELDNPTDLDEWRQPRILSESEFQELVRDMNERKGGDLLSAPSVTTPSGRPAKIEIVREFIYPTEYSPAIVNNEADRDSDSEGFGVAPAMPLSFKTREVGVSADITPRILPDGRIELTFAPRVTQFDEFRNFGRPIHLLDLNRPAERHRVVVTENRMETPVFSRRALKTTVRLEDGETLFFGGLAREETQSIQDKVPFVGDLPLIGRMAQNETEIQIRRHLFFAVKAQLAEKE